MEYANAYEKLYDKMKTKFTVIKNNNEYTLGEYMAMKSQSALARKNEEKPNTRTPSSFLAYLGEKMAARSQSRENHAFPLKTLASACLSLMVVSALVFSFGAVSSKGDTSPVTEIVEGTEDNVDYDILNSKLEK